MFEHVFHTWAAQDATVARAHAVYARDGWRCTVPGCSSYRNLHRHHIQFRSRGGSDDDANCTTVCAWHHQRGIHGPGVVSCRGTAPDGLRFELGVRGSAPPLVAYRSGDVIDEVVAAGIS
ncbi:MAG: HNH endonuclease [Myxococcota bacterium]|nr:HNH endonuclease [Myxococcota bacterium]